jgi:hypothetical protein
MHILSTEELTSSAVVSLDNRLAEKDAKSTQSSQFKVTLATTVQHFAIGVCATIFQASVGKEPLVQDLPTLGWMGPVATASRD